MYGWASALSGVHDVALVWAVLLPVADVLHWSVKCRESLDDRWS